MNSYLSRKLKILSFIATILVVYIHVSPGADIVDATREVAKTSGLANTLIAFYIQDGLARVAVPLFFIISGYLFFRNIMKPSKTVVFKAKSDGGGICQKV
jgi:surface polysaccharide O-acyltransferase-like enzyme